MTDFTLALGGGGVKGLAHLALLKELDRLGVKPKAIAGTSIGAIMGALYASGLSGLEIEERVRDHLFSRGDGLKNHFNRRKHLVKWVKVFSFERSRGGLFTADGLFEHLFTEVAEHNFGDLSIPFTAVCTDFHTGEEVALSQGNLLDAVRASMAVPGVFAPVEIDGRLLVDGGLVNNVPCSHVKRSYCLTVASDVVCLDSHKQPKTTQVLSGSISIMLCHATKQAFTKHPPDFVFKPDTARIDAFDFHRIAQLLERGEEAIERQREALKRTLKLPLTEKESEPINPR